MAEDPLTPATSQVPATSRDAAWQELAIWLHEQNKPGTRWALLKHPFFLTVICGSLLAFAGYIWQDKQQARSDERARNNQRIEMRLSLLKSLDATTWGYSGKIMEYLDTEHHWLGALGAAEQRHAGRIDDLKKKVDEAPYILDADVPARIDAEILEARKRLAEQPDRSSALPQPTSARTAWDDAILNLAKRVAAEELARGEMEKAHSAEVMAWRQGFPGLAASQDLLSAIEGVYKNKGIPDLCSVVRRAGIHLRSLSIRLYSAPADRKPQPGEPSRTNQLTEAGTARLSLEEAVEKLRDAMIQELGAAWTE